MDSYIPEGYSSYENILKSLKAIYACLRCLWSLLFGYVIDPIISLFTGKNEYARILCKGSHNSRMTRELKKCILQSKSMNSTKKLLLKHERYDIDEICEHFIEEASLKRTAKFFTPEFQLNINRCFVQLAGANVAMHTIDRLTNEKYDSTNPAHEQLLMELWRNLKGDEALEGRYTSQWGEIGFQGKDPSTDFRGLGVLSLRNLVYYSRERPTEAVNCLRQSDVTRGGYPMAITGIQISALLNNWLSKREIDHEFFSVVQSETVMSEEERSLHFYQELFCRVFTRFDAFYEKEHPENLTYFPIIWKKFEKQTLDLIHNDSFYLRLF